MGNSTLAAIFLVLAAVSVVAPFVFIHLPALSRYNKKFESHVVMAHDQATLEGMKEQVIILWKNMNDTFKGEDLAEIYNTPWYWDQTYDNSLKATEDYYRKLVSRLDSYILMYNRMQMNASNPLLIEDWYAKSITNMRTEMAREGDLDWALQGAYFLYKEPLDYWSGIWISALALTLLFLAFVFSED